jgi:hypothetical protein
LKLYRTTEQSYLHALQRHELPVHVLINFET